MLHFAQARADAFGPLSSSYLSWPVAWLSCSGLTTAYRFSCYFLGLSSVGDGSKAFVRLENVVGGWNLTGVLLGQHFAYTHRYLQPCFCKVIGRPEMLHSALLPTSAETDPSHWSRKPLEDSWLHNVTLHNESCGTALGSVDTFGTSVRESCR